jgi:hypothetical protein
MFRRVREKFPEAMLVFAVRRKTPAAGPVEARIKSDAALWGLGPHVRFLNEVDDVPGLLTLADLSILPVERLYAKMDMPLVLLEHMALGRPVVVSDSAPLRETIQGGRGGIAVKHGDVAAGGAVVDLLRDDRARADLGRSAAARGGGVRHPPERRGLRQSLRRASAGEAMREDVLKDNRSYYDAFSERYEQGRDAGYHALVDALTVDLVLRYARGRDVLEVGCGTGLILKDVAREARRAMGVDLSAGAAAPSARGAWPRGRRRSFASSFDVVCLQVLPHVRIAAASPR